MDANQLKKAILILIGMGLGLQTIGCGSSTPGPAEAKSVAQGTDSGSNTTSSGSNGGVTVTNIYSQPKELGVGDLLYVDLNGGQSSLSFSEVDAAAEFMFVLANTASSSGNFAVQISGDLSEPEFALEDPSEEENFEAAKSIDANAGVDPQLNDITEQFHDALRAKEKELEILEMPEAVSGVSKSVSGNVSASISEGDESSFKVLASLSSTSSSVTVSAVAECVGSNVIFYVDKRVSVDMLSAADVDALCSRFDATVAKEATLFGSPSDVNNDGKVVVLLTPQVNKLGALGGGIVTGFFNAVDLYPNSSTNPVSNYMEILYIMVPDPNGEFGVLVSKEFALSNLLPAVLPHEFQHAISYNQHVFVNKGNSEEGWLNEGMSHLAEDLMGENQENPSRFAIFLQSPHSYSLVTAKSPGLAARGAAYLFLRYLCEQAENKGAFLQKMVQTSFTGTANVEKAFGGRAGDFDQFGEFFLRWSVALAMTDRGITQDRRFTYQPRVQNAETGNWGGVCLSCIAQDNRGTAPNGVSLKPYGGSQNATTGGTAARFYTVSKVKEKLDFNSAYSQGEGFGVLIRTK